MPTDEILQKILQEQARMSEQIKGALRRIDEQTQLTKSVHELALSVQMLANQQKQTEKKVDRLSDDVDEIKGKPGKRWESITGIVITAIATAAVTFILTRLGLK